MSLKLAEMNISQFLRNTVRTVLFAVPFSIRIMLFGSHSIVRTADADWIGANYEHKAMREVQILENRIRRIRYT